ncbi:hypothetical protein Trydic_g10803 [Trypoxylus dichotomus]
MCLERHSALKLTDYFRMIYAIERLRQIKQNTTRGSGRIPRSNRDDTATISGLSLINDCGAVYDVSRVQEASGPRNKTDGRISEAREKIQS